MGDYDLSGLSSRSFEKLIQALAVKVLGSGTVVFGDGPDGGREATFDGRMDYHPSEDEPWDGYCVLQAKFRQRPEGAGKDGKWALAQLKKELEDFADREKRRRIPEYYIFATNVVLSSVQGKGTKDKVSDLFRNYERKVPIQDWRVWDFDQISTFLDDAPDIRRTYAAWVTPGDVLAQVLDGLKPKKTAFLEVMTSFLARDLVRDQYANLEPAGHTAEDRIPLARVFVDLPTTTERTAEPPQEDSEGKTKVAELAATLVNAARDSLRPTTSMQFDQNISSGATLKDQVDSRVRPQPGRYVLVGGPGQGKTTISQFVCQLFRAALLQDRPPRLLPPEVRDTLADIEKHCNAGGPDLPRVRRFPVRIALSDFATALSQEPELSVLEYVATLIRSRARREVSTEDLRTWLGDFPWLLVLDGLDEVPASTNRNNVLRKVEEMWIDAAQCDADLLVLATTRPQGYNEDFSPQRYRHLWLAPLSVKRALAYARRLMEVRYAGDEGRQEKILRRLEQASGVDATARLMSSPLQVTILAILVDHIGPPPQDRWQLFNDYYEVIYRRERERDIPAATILRDHRSNIDAIHHQVGLLLQLEAERAGGTEANLPANRFESIVAARLESEGYEGQELDSLRMAIIEAAAHRLVFLVELETDRVGFEIRSFQEFMAAQALMSGKDENVQKRLRRIAPISSWRNVFLFAAGRCFSQPDKEHFRETIFTLCMALNDEETGEVAKAVSAGSQLALELLEDGVARQQPKYARFLAECACGLLEQPPASLHERLTELAPGATEHVLRQHLERWLRRDVPESLAAWTTLYPLLNMGLQWARELAKRYSPEEPSGLLKTLSVPTAASAGESLADPMERAARGNHPFDIYHVYFQLRELLDRWCADRPLSRLIVQRWRAEESIRIPIKSLGLYVDIVSLQHAKRISQDWKKIDGPETHPGWLPLIEGRMFVMEPSAKSLAETLRRIATSPVSFPLWTGPGVLPWVLESCLAAATTPADMMALAGRAAAGDLGDVEIWQAAERRWQNQGASLDDLLLMKDHRWPFDRSIASRGIVVRRFSFGGRLAETYMTSIDPLQSASRLQELLAWAAQLELRHYRSPHPPTWLNPGKLVRLFERSREGIELSVCAKLASWCQHEKGWLVVLDTVGRMGKRFFSVGTSHPGVFASLFDDNPDKLSLLPILAACVLHTPDPDSVPTVRFEDYDESSVCRSALLLELARGGMTSARALDLARVTPKMAEANLEFLRQANRIIQGFERFDESSELYLLELLNHPRTNEFETARAILDTLEKSFRRRTSGLADRNVWQDLALPEGLLDY